ncbi:MAG: hypothetical protein ABW203_06870 [Novosphingobium sp.]
MRNLIGTALAAAAVVALPAMAGARERLQPEAKLEKMLAGRVAGEAVDCIYTPSIRDTRIVDKTAIVYEVGRVLYVNRPDSGASSLDDDDILITKLHGTQLCSIDIVQLRDRSTHFYSGLVGLGDFVPYRKVAARP